MIAVYAIRHVASGRCYIGSSREVETRWKNHVRELEAGTHANRHLQSAWRLYGRSAFKFEVLEEAPDELRVERESYHLRAAPGAYNILEPGEPPNNRGQHILQRAGPERYRASWTPERRAAHSAKIKGRKAPAAERAKISAAMLGRPSPLRGRTLSPEHRARIRMARWGR